MVSIKSSSFAAVAVLSALNLVAAVPLIPNDLEKSNNLISSKDTVLSSNPASVLPGSNAKSSNLNIQTVQESKRSNSGKSTSFVGSLLSSLPSYILRLVTAAGKGNLTSEIVSIIPSVLETIFESGFPFGFLDLAVQGLEKEGIEVPSELVEALSNALTSNLLALPTDSAEIEKLFPSGLPEISLPTASS